MPVGKHKVPDPRGAPERLGVDTDLSSPGDFPKGGFAVASTRWQRPQTVIRPVRIHGRLPSMLSDNSQPGGYGRAWQAALGRHVFQRVRILRSAVTTHSVCLTLKSEDTAEISVVTSKEEIENGYEDRHTAPLYCWLRSHAWLRAQTGPYRIKLNSSVLLQVTSQFEHVPKPLVFRADPASCSRHGVTFRGQCRNPGIDLGPEVHQGSAIQ